MKTKWFLLAMAVMMLAACSPYKYYTTQSKNGAFSQYKTYAWLPGLDSLSKSYYNNSIAQENIYEAADAALKAKGLTYSENNPDLLFRYKAIVNNTSRTVYAPMYGGWGWGWGWGPYWGWGMGGAVGRERYRAGHIIIEAVDAKTKKIVWQGRGSGEVSNPEKAVNDLPVVVQNIMKQYPVMAQN
ncbi:DUF4136 domain-containing protein [Olivibacter sp. CPCC 100613]|uniref:DUF4136 domain-containing protein n=1 Tax=Olivibacter sp. CPCC 100613 TaxID=3079931 RepID=UPI002FF6FF41